MKTPVIQWRLREQMKLAGIPTARALYALIRKNHDDVVSYSQIARIVDRAPARLPLSTLAILVGVLGCTIEDLLSVCADEQQDPDASG